MANNGLRKEEFRELAPSFVGMSLVDAAELACCKPNSLRVRFSRENYDAKIRHNKETNEDIIEELEYYGISLGTSLFELNRRFDPWPETEKPEPLSYVPPQVIVMGDDYDHLIKVHHSRDKKHSKFRHYL
jgi:hypothetical protein